jgi:Putative transposase of IS4/5 family (DUF4096)
VLLLLSEPEDARRRAGLQWSDWRRRHQARAQRDHVARRAARQPLPAALPTPTVLAGTAPLTDQLWQQVTRLLPPQKPPRGRPALDHRRLLEGLLWVMRTGAPWREIPAAYGSWHTLYSRYRRWDEDGLWTRICAVLHPPAPTSNGLT